MDVLARNRFSRTSLASGLLACLCLVTFPLAEAVAQTSLVSAPPFRAGVVLVGFYGDVTSDEQADVVMAAGAVDLYTIGAGTHVLRVPPGDELATLQALQSRKEVRYAEPDWLGHADAVPNDPGFSLQWAFQNTGEAFGGIPGVVGTDEKAVPAWDVTTGSTSIVVGVTDTGIDYTHSDLAANVWSNPGNINGCGAGTHGYNVLKGSCEPMNVTGCSVGTYGYNVVNGACDPMDDDTVYGGHGTHVSGIVGAVSNNNNGVAGLNWNAKLLAVKWLDSQANGTTSDLITALDWLVRAKQAGVNIRVVNDSATFVATAYSQALSDEIDVLGANDILFVTAAGNSGQSDDDLTTRRYPCGYMRPNELCVAAADNTDHLWSSSNYGVETVNLAAPGYDIYSTLRGNTYGYISGCSTSAAEVSGAAALILSTGYQSVTALRATILDNLDVLGQLNGLVQTSGRLNIVNSLLPRSTPPTTTTTTTVGIADGCAAADGAGELTDVCQRCAERMLVGSSVVMESVAIGLQCQVARIGMALSTLACSPDITRRLARRMEGIRRLSDRLSREGSVPTRQVETRLARHVAALARALHRAARHRGCHGGAAAEAVETLGNYLRGFQEVRAPQ